MDELEKRQSNYSRLYIMMAILHLAFLIIFMVEKCKILSAINVILIAVYIVLSQMAKGAKVFKELFITSGIAFAFFIVSHYICLGPTACFQYLSLGSVPLVFYLGYTNGKNIKASRNVVVAIFFCVLIMSIGCARINYPIFDIHIVVIRIIAFVNLVLSFALAILFMNSFVYRTVIDSERLMGKNVDLEESANIDTLTGLRNRRSIDMHIDRAFKLAKGEGKDFSILMCDIDNFKHVNDTYGHDCGDLVLKNIAQIITKEIRPEDIVFRWGGEEILILVYANGYVAKNVAERCRSTIEESYVEYNGQKISVTITIGGATYYQGATEKVLIKRADDNLYKGKSSGKNQVVI